VRADQLEDTRVHVRPDALVGFRTVETPRVGRRSRGSRAGRGRCYRCTGLGHVVDRDDHLYIELLARARVEDGHRPRPLRCLPAEEPRDLVERALRGRQADALRRPVGDRLEALERQRQVRAALRGRQRVDLVDDDRFDAAQHFACLRREHQVERLGGGDQDVGRRARDVLALFGRRVARAHRDGRWRELGAEPFGRQRDAGDRGSQVLLDVDRERAQRGDVEHAAPLRLGGHGRGAQAVDGREKCCESLTGTCRCEQQRVLAGRDGGPALRLGAGRRAEARLEPGPGGRAEAFERGFRHGFTVPAGSQAPVRRDRAGCCLTETCSKPDGGRVVVWRRGWTRDAGLALALLLLLGAPALPRDRAGARIDSGVHTAEGFAARLPSIGAVRSLRARDVTAPGTPRGAFAWTITLLAAAFASTVRRRGNRVGLVAHLRTRAPPDLRSV
jgi:hypothetical protein